MITKENVKKEIDRLSDTELEKVHRYLSLLDKRKKTSSTIRSLKLNGKLDDRNLRSLAYE
ncbi:MAG: hypothetical protein AAFW89_06920 [Bacteroidota bacterium]